MAKDANSDRLLQKSKLSAPGVVLPEQVEEEARIVKVDFYRSYLPKTIFFFLLVLVTGGILLLILKWVPKLYALFRYVKGSPRTATYLAVYCANGTVDYVHVHEKELCIDKATKKYRVFKYRLYTFYYDPVTNQFKPIQFVLRNKTFKQIHQEMGHGFATEEAYNDMLSNYGRNSTDLEERSNLEIIFDEILSPFYIFQLFAVLYWNTINPYREYAGVIIGVSIITLTVTFYKIKINYKKLRQKSSYETEISVFRSPEEINRTEEIIVKMIPKTISSTWLVPGDLIEIPSEKKMPCDIILISGTCIMNESMFTGDSIPVIKQQLPKSDKAFDINTASPYLLLSGTECLETRQTSSELPVLGIVLRTGFDTTKGRLIRSFIYSKSEEFSFYKDSLKYVGAMTCIAMICFGINASLFISQGESGEEIFNKFLDLITTAVPPILPTVIAIGTALATTRLERQKIVAKSELKINTAGKVRFMCFDKTGTLTKDSFDLHCVVPIKKEEKDSAKFESVIKEDVPNALDSTNRKTFKHEMLELMATCHSLTYVKGHIAGDPLDVKMFGAVGWTYVENTGRASFDFRIATLTPPEKTNPSAYYDAKYQIIVLKRFEFSSALQRMSVIIKDAFEGKQRVYVKGAPETIFSLSRPETIPADFNRILANYTHSGLRVIACATKVLEKSVMTNDDLEREPFEKDLEFLGFIVFENKTKEVTAPVIQHLKEADIKTIMLTGDNPLTSISVARDCGIIERNQRVALGKLVSAGEDSETKQIEWKFVDAIEIDGTEEVPLLKEQVELTIRHKSSIGDEAFSQDYIIEAISRDSNLAVAMSGEAFNHFVLSNKDDPSLNDLILRRCKIFARLRPDDKATIIAKIQKQGYVVGMCGDGANDCPGLKAANIGISLSEAEASLAAPFMSKVLDISCVDVLLREGRAALVTSFQCFRYMSIYSLIQAFLTVICNTRSTTITNPCWMYQDIFITIPTAFSISLTAPTSKLSKEEPIGNLMSLQILFTMVGQIGIQVGAQIIAVLFLENQDWYVSPTDLTAQLVEETEDEEAVAPDYVVSVLFVVSNIQLICTFMTFYIAKPFRQPFYKNIVFTICMSAALIMSVIFLLVPMPSVFDNFEMKEVPQDFKLILLAIVAVNSFATICYEKLIVPAVFFVGRKLFRKRKPNKQNIYAA